MQTTLNPETHQLTLPRQRRDYLAKIADVGIAKVLTETHMNSLTSTGTFAWVRAVPP